jgi:hypothetical protein
MTKDELYEIRNLVIELWQVKRLLLDARDKAVSLKSQDYSRDRVQTSLSQNNTVDDVVDYEKEFAKIQEKLNRKKAIARKEVDELSDWRERLVLKNRYFSAMSWKEIYIAMHYSRSQINKYHRNALKNISGKGKQW